MIYLNCVMTGIDSDVSVKKHIEKYLSQIIKNLGICGGKNRCNALRTFERI